MARGKQTCKILKEIRRQIAEANGIEFATSECRYKGDCLGTCPKCEAEVRYLEQQLRARSLAGKAIALAGISAGMILMSGCSGTVSKSQPDDALLRDFTESPEMIEEIEDIEEGELPIIEDTVSSGRSENLIGVKEGEITENYETVRVHGEIIVPDPTTNSDENRIYQFVEQMPEFPGGQAAMLKFIADNLKYPKEMAGCFQGIVRVKFYVDTLGHVCDPQIVSGLDSALDREVLRVVRLLPEFIPGQHEGKKVNVYMNLPISLDPNR